MASYPVKHIPLQLVDQIQPLLKSQLTYAADYCTCVMQAFICLVWELNPLLGCGGGFPDISPDSVKENDYITYEKKAVDDPAARGSRDLPKTLDAVFNSHNSCMSSYHSISISGIDYFFLISSETQFSLTATETT